MDSDLSLLSQLEKVLGKHLSVVHSFTMCDMLSCGAICLCGGLATLKMQCLVPICMLKDNVHLSQDHTISTLGSLLDSMLAEHANALFALFESLLPLGLKTAVLDWFRFCASPPRLYPLSIARLFRAATMSRGLWSRGTSDHLQTHMVLPFFLF